MSGWVWDLSGSDCARCERLQRTDALPNLESPPTGTAGPPTRGLYPSSGNIVTENNNIYELQVSYRTTIIISLAIIIPGFNFNSKNKIAD